MEWYQWLAFAALIIDITGLIIHLFRLISLGKPNDLSTQRGEILPSLVYAFSGAMSPSRKESAFLHLPTYIAGIFYHVGTFISIFIFFLLLLGMPISKNISLIISGFLAISVVGGFGILLKRILSKRLRSLSNPDDYISNLLVTLFQVLTILVFYQSYWLPVYYILVSILLIYIPIGKLKHAVYFFAARYHLGYFYGWRGVWPQKKY